jgi:hypothetical protein
VTVCENALPYIWNGTPYPAGGTFTVTLPGQGEECDTLATLILTVLPIIETTDEVTVCENALPYIWNGTPYPAGGTFTVTLPGQGEDCDTLATLILTIAPIIETTDEVTVCENALPYIWNGTPYPAGGTFTVTLPGQGEDCDTLATLILTIAPIIETTDEVTVCENALPYIWNGTPYPAGGTFTVTLPGQGEDCDTLATLILTVVPVIEATETVEVCENALPYIWNGTPYPAGGTFTVTLPGQGEDCDTLATLILTVVPVIETTETVEVCENALPYIWNGTPYPAGGTFTVTLPGQGGDCDTLATLILTVLRRSSRRRTK